MVEKIHEEGIKILERVGEVRISPDAREDTLCKEAADVDAILVRSSPLTAGVIESSKKLKVISRHGIGVDHIDLKAATRKGVVVLNAPEANINAVAEHTIAFILACAKRLAVMDRRLREGRYFKAGSLPGIVSSMEGTASYELAGKRLGLIGAGRIPTVVAEMCSRSFAMEVAAYDPFVSPEKMKGMGMTSLETLDEILSSSDFVSLHVPLTRDTRGMIGHRELRLMKKSAYLINTARGEVLDEEALEEALRSGVIAGAALDVFCKEPPDPKGSLFACPNLIVTPHMAALSDQSLVRMAVDSATGIEDFFSGRRPKNIVNPEALSKA